MAGTARFFSAVLLRFCRLFYLRHWCRFMPWLYIAKQFSIALCGHWIFQFLAALAHHSFHLVLLLPLYFIRRKPPWYIPHFIQYHVHYVPGWTLERCVLDFHRMEGSAWKLSGNWTFIAIELQRPTMGKNPGGAFCAYLHYFLFRQHCLGLLSS